MKHYIIFATFFLLPRGTIYAMENNQLNEHQPLRSEIFFAYTINKQENLPKDVTDYILTTSCLLNMQRYKHPHGNYQLNLNLLGKKAAIDFLYLTNKQVNTFLALHPDIIKREGIFCINIVDTNQYRNTYHTLPKEIQKHPLWLVKEYDD